MPLDEVTIGELSRRLSAFEKRVDDGFKGLGEKIQSLEYVHVDRYEAEQVTVDLRITAVDTRVAAGEERLRWLTRMATTALVSAVLTVAVTIIGYLLGAR
jgi:hypothetical protein